MKYHLQWDPGKQPKGAPIVDFDSEKEALEYVQKFLLNANFRGPWLPSFGTTDQFKRIYHPTNATEEEVGKVILFVDAERQLPDTTIFPPPKPPWIS
jgi:hypothetical protein